jgi:hypothetical protein
VHSATTQTQLDAALAAVPDELKALPQWVVWRAKIPYHPPSAGRASSINSATWVPYADAVAVARRFDGVGYVFSASDPYAGVDLDDCIADDGTIAGWAQAIIRDLNSYTEISPSGRGVKIWVRGSLPSSVKQPYQTGAVELYDRARFFTVTGKHLPGTPLDIRAADGPLAALYWMLKTIRRIAATSATADPLDAADAAYSLPYIQAALAGELAALGRTPAGNRNNQLNTAAFNLGQLVAAGALDRGVVETVLTDVSAAIGLDATEIRDTIKSGLDGGARHPRNGTQPTTAPPPSPAGASTTPTPGPQAPPWKKLKELLARHFAPIKWAVPGILVEGCNILAAKPKAGKSLLALDVGLAVAAGGLALGKKQVEAGDVLYLSLEDGERRLKGRTLALLLGANCPDRFDYQDVWPKLDQGGLALIESWLQTHPDRRLVIIDTLVRVRPAAKRGQSLYDFDYDSVKDLKDLANRYSVTLLVIHHTRKADAGDFIDELNASTGLAAVVDSILILKRARGQADAELHITGKDANEDALPLRFIYPSWELLDGTAEEYQLSRERDAIITVLEQAGEPLTPAQVADLLGKHRNAVGKLMWEMRGDHQLVGGGKLGYDLPTTHTPNNNSNHGKGSKVSNRGKDGKLTQTYFDTVYQSNPEIGSESDQTTHNYQDYQDYRSYRGPAIWHSTHYDYPVRVLGWWDETTLRVRTMDGMLCGYPLDQVERISPDSAHYAAAMQIPADDPITAAPPRPGAVEEVDLPDAGTPATLIASLKAQQAGAA